MKLLELNIQKDKEIQFTGRENIMAFGDKWGREKLDCYHVPYKIMLSFDLTNDNAVKQIIHDNLNQIITSIALIYKSKPMYYNEGSIVVNNLKEFVANIPDIINITIYYKQTLCGEKKIPAYTLNELSKKFFDKDNIKYALFRFNQQSIYDVTINNVNIPYKYYDKQEYHRQVEYGSEGNLFLFINENTRNIINGLYRNLNEEDKAIIYDYFENYLLATDLLSDNKPKLYESYIIKKYNIIKPRFSIFSSIKKPPFTPTITDIKFPNTNSQSQYAGKRKISKKRISSKKRRSSGKKNKRYNISKKNKRMN
jgi:hypothetical protein